jgi:hypothetical protein
MAEDGPFRSAEDGPVLMVKEDPLPIYLYANHEVERE